MNPKIRKKITKGQNLKTVEYHNYLVNELNMSKTFCEYFLVIGLDPRISMRTYLYNTEPQEILKYYSHEIKPEILTKFPPMQKNYINIDNSIINIIVFGMDLILKKVKQNQNQKFLIIY